MTSVFRTLTHIDIYAQLYSHAAYSPHSLLHRSFTYFQRPVTFIAFRRNASLHKHFPQNNSLIDAPTKRTLNNAANNPNNHPKPERLILSFTAVESKDHNSDTKTSLLSKPTKEDSKKKDEKNVKTNKLASATSVNLMNTRESSIVMHRLNNLGILGA
jgi:hypothetical protein